MKRAVWFVVLTYRQKVNELFSHPRNCKAILFVLVDNSENRNEFSDWINVLRTGKNLGYSGGMNRGISYCLDRGADWIILINNDLKITPKILNELVKKLKKIGPGIAGPFLGSFDFNRWTTIYPKRGKDGLGYISGSCLAIHRDVLGKIGNFYEPYFMYYEDADFCVRAKKAGFSLIHLPDLDIAHDDATSLGRGSFLHQYYLARNHLLFVERNAPLPVKIHELLRLPKTIWEHVSREEWGALAGIRDYFLRRFGKYTPLW